LLAYLDDTLDPTEIKQIGQKVAESDSAQELIARIKQVTRHRRLTTPPDTGPGGFEPNTIAEYLDNALSTEQVAEIEKTCLESDVHLAEIAACHQILTLVLGEPALVPPTAKQRMYGLVRGRESSRRRAPATAPAQAPATVAARGGAEAEDESVLGLPLSRRSGGLTNWLLPLTALALLVAIAVIIWQAVMSRQGTVAVVAVSSAKNIPEPPPTTREPAGGTELAVPPKQQTAPVSVAVRK
jgi:hypothetical protein